MAKKRNLLGDAKMKKMIHKDCNKEEALSDKQFDCIIGVVGEVGMEHKVVLSKHVREAIKKEDSFIQLFILGKITQKQFWVARNDVFGEDLTK